MIEFVTWQIPSFITWQIVNLVVALLNVGVLIAIVSLVALALAGWSYVLFWTFSKLWTRAQGIDIMRENKVST